VKNIVSLMRIYCETYGCTSNRADTEIMLGLAENAGHEVVSDPTEADVVLINTCAVKGTTYRRMLGRLSNLLRTNKRIIVAGCLPLIDPKAVADVGKFAAVMSCKSVGELPELLRRISRGENGVRIVTSGGVEKPTMPKKRLSCVSAAVPIAEGCTSNCSYCSVKFARGRLRSFKIENVVEEAEHLVKLGYHEILLTAQDTAAYGADGGAKLPEVIRRVSSLPADFRIRIGMMNPKNVRPILDDLVEAFQNRHVYKFLHLPVQSGSDKILSAMGREYTSEEFLGIVRTFRKKIPELYLCTDIIVGFPGETEEDFQQTKELLERVKPDKTNISRFSPMPGTDAANLPQINGRIIAARSRELSELCRRIGWGINKRYEGKIMDGFIIEPGEKGGYILRSENYKQVIVKSGEMGEFLKVKITEAFPTYLKGERLDDSEK